jgi:hypothetical protein
MSSVQQVIPPTVPPTYFKAGYPVLSFLYAMYTDSAVSDDAIARYRRDHNDDGYLNPYRVDEQRPFPKGARDIIHVELPATRPEEGPKHVRRPDAALVEKAMPYLVAEMAKLPPQPGDGVSPPPSSAPASKAAVNAEFPLVSCLGVIFLNQDPAFQTNPDRFLAQFNLPASVASLLKAFAATGTPTADQAFALLPALTDELTSKACW